MAMEELQPPAKRFKMKRRQSSVQLAQQRAGLVETVEHCTPAADAKETQVEQAEQARQMFVEHDANGDGVLDYGEFRHLLRSVGQECNRLHPHYIEHFLHVTDVNHDGIITLDEFIRIHKQLQAFDRLLLHAPRRQQAAAAAPPEATSRLKTHPELECPPMATVSLPIEERTRRRTEEDKEEEEEDDDEDEDEDTPPPPPPFIIDGHFADLKQIGQGGYGMLVRARDTRTDKLVAIKRVCPTGDALQLRLCLRELAILHHFRAHPHPNVLGLVEVLRPPGPAHLSVRPPPTALHRLPPPSTAFHRPPPPSTAVHRPPPPSLHRPPPSSSLSPPAAN